MTVATTAAPVTTSYVYDGDGRRVQKTVGSTTTTFVYDAQGHPADRSHQSLAISVGFRGADRSFQDSNAESSQGLIDDWGENRIAVVDQEAVPGRIHSG